MADSGLHPGRLLSSLAPIRQEGAAAGPCLTIDIMLFTYLLPNPAARVQPWVECAARSADEQRGRSDGVVADPVETSRQTMAGEGRSMPGAASCVA